MAMATKVIAHSSLTFKRRQTSLKMPVGRNVLQSHYFIISRISTAITGIPRPEMCLTVRQPELTCSSGWPAE